MPLSPHRRFRRLCLGALLPCLACYGTNQAPDSGPPVEDSGPPSQCTIAAASYAANTPNPDNRCQSCQPLASAGAWTDLALGTQCAAGAVCAEGTCFAGCAIDGVFYPPDALNHQAACQSCQPQSNTSAWSPLTSTAGEGCDGGNDQCFQGLCQAGCLIDGVLVFPGTADPKNGCRVCAPPSNRTDWSVADDGTLCGASQVCSSGTCQSGCFIDGAFREPGALDPSNPCASCEPLLGTFDFSPSSGLPAGPGCPAGAVCNGGVCAAGCFIGGTNVASGSRTSGDGGECCSPLHSVSAWTAALQPSPALQTGSGPMGVALADFNGDGVPDIATVNRADSTVTVFLSTSDGGFGEPIVLPVGAAPVALVAVDLDGDRRPDLVTANADDQTVSVLLNSGSGSSGTASFGPPKTYGTLGRPSALAIADLDGDHRPDIAVTNLDQGTVAVLFATGGGAFGGAIPVGVGNLPQAIAAIDIDGDKQIDLVIVNLGDDNLDVLRNTGNGVFAAPVPYPVGVHPAALAAGDLNGDGKPDLVVANIADQTLSVLLNTGNGTFAPQSVLGVGLAAYSLALADLDGDGIPDIALADHQGGRAGVLTNQGKGTFAPPFYAMVGAPFSAFALAAGDLDRDGAVDLAMVGLDGASLVVLRNQCP